MKFRTILAVLVACCVSISSMHGMQLTQDFLEGRKTVDTLLKYIIEAGIYGQETQNWASDIRGFVPTELGKIEIQKLNPLSSRCAFGGFDMWQELKNKIAVQKAIYDNMPANFSGRPSFAAIVMKRIQDEIAQIAYCIGTWETTKGWVK